MRIRTLPHLILAVALGLAGCQAPPQDSAPAGPADGPVGEASPVAAPGPRVAVMAPSAAELMHVLGLIDRVVATGDFVQWPPETRELPRIGAYNAPNEELLLALKVDVMITSYSEAANPRLRRLEALGVEVLALETSTYEGVFESLQQVGRTFGAEQKAQAVEIEIRQRLESIRQRAANAPRRKVLVAVGRDPLYVAGPGSHLDQMITLAGGSNIAADAKSPYQLVSLEAMLERRPEVIVDTSENHPGARRGRHLGSWQQWPFLPAVQQQQVYWVDPTRLVIAGPRLPEMTELLGRMIHPEIFGEPSSDEFEPLR